MQFHDDILTAGPCPECHGPRQAALTGVEATANRSAKTQWWLWCPACWALPWEGSMVWWVIAMDAHGNMQWWMRPGATMAVAKASELLLHVSHCFTRLLEARKDKIATQGLAPWALDLREDGRVWFPLGRFAVGPAVALRHGVLRKAKKCHLCPREISESEGVWRVDDSTIPDNRWPWTKTQLREIAVCYLCHLQAVHRPAAVERGGKAVGPFIVFDGGSEASGATRPGLVVVSEGKP